MDETPVVAASSHTLGDSVSTLADLVPWWTLPLLAVLLFGASVGWVIYNGQHRQHRRTTWPIYRRARLRMWPGPGFAGRWVLGRDYGLLRAWKVAKRRRPDLARRDRVFGPRGEISVYHGKAQGFLYGLGRHKVRSTFEDNSLTVAPPQEGKSVSAVPVIWDAPGAVVVNTIRGDLLRSSAGYRATLGGEILVFNPANVGEYGSTFKWNPVEGCRAFDVAVRRAGYMVEAQTSQGMSNADFWDDQGVMYLGPLLHAADLVMGDHDDLVQDEEWADLLPEPISMRTITHWISTASLVPYEILRRHPGASRSAAEALLRFFRETPLKTRQSIVTTLGRTLRFMLDESVSNMLVPRRGDITFDAELFVRSRDSLYLISPPPEGRSPVAPLMAAFLGELFTTAVAANERHRFDRPLTMVLDEVANTVPVPLASWTSYSAGSGITLHLYTQALSQFVTRWGRDAADEIVSNCKVVKIWPTVKGESRKLLDASTGKVRLVRKDKQEYQDRKGGTKSRTVRHETWEDALPHPGRDIPDGYVVCTLREKTPTVIQPPTFWKDKRFIDHPVENLTLPPVTQRHVPEAIPELLAQIHKDTVREGATLPKPETNGTGGGGSEKRSPDKAPPLNRGGQSSHAGSGSNPLDGFEVDL
ncbi:type IV secretory system conjugative DNA transfer family protein [Nocardiopsis tropica]|uniref:TraM recognition domain-containing protein n=1 Tax=Nocardiopsis tropica TaxID=109330 RepID=A0ABU7KR91_9ACTN|nr:type IV secretory system conjugative DNA transfer family protein [Nocardiopsis umidischolae]MEE2051797.1 TraM recognition domain-containing protein [Nocardiopsis umidischolae]